MNTLVRTGVGLLIVLSTAGVAPSGAQQASAPQALRLPVTGTFARGGDFQGTITINRFERRGTDIVAVGFVAGVLSRGAQAVGTAVAGEVVWPVRVTSGGVAVVNDPAPVSQTARVLRAAWSPGMSAAAPLRVQAATCPVLNVALGANTVDLLGVDVALSPVTVDLTGTPGTPLGDLVCAASDLLGNVAGLVNLLNNILGLVTGLLGGLTGGLGGAIPLP